MDVLGKSPGQWRAIRIDGDLPTGTALASNYLLLRGFSIQWVTH
jgi:hypothetical protein